MSTKNLDRKRYKVREIIESYLSLEKRGSNYWALCPFHDDNRASLSVSEEKNIFKCFSCGVSGDAISFIMRKDKVSLQEALLKAHEILKLPTDELPYFKKISPEEELKQNLLKFNKFMLEFYSSSLNSPGGTEAINYLQQNRKLSYEIISKFQLGYSPAGEEITQTLYNLQKIDPEFKFLTQEFLLQTGQFYLSGEKLMHSFRDKLIFPIFDIEGKILSFSARSIKDNEEGPRYFHSKETLLFKKGDYLYNSQTLQHIKKDAFIYLFEGFFDLYTAYALNPAGAYLALLGSELSDTSLKMLSNLPTKKIVIALDNDKAGRSATLKLFKKALNWGLELYALPPLAGKDLSESYQRDNSIKLPDPISFADWVKLNWTSLFPDSENGAKLFSINQLVLSFLNSLFYSRNVDNQLFLSSKVSPKNALVALEQLFQLYEIVELSSKEQEIINSFKSKYVEIVNLKLLSSNQIEHLLFEEEKLETEKKPENLVTCFSNILENWEKVMNIHSASIFFQTRNDQWKTPLLDRYSNKLQLILLPEEKEFLAKLTENISKLSNSLTPLKSSKTVKSSASEIFNFLELYYLMIHQLMDKYEKLIKQGPKLNLGERVSILDSIEKDRQKLREQSSRIFKEVVNWERAYAEGLKS